MKITKDTVVSDEFNIVVLEIDEPFQSFLLNHEKEQEELQKYKSLSDGLKKGIGELQAENAKLTAQVAELVEFVKCVRDGSPNGNRIDHRPEAAALLSKYGVE